MKYNHTHFSIELLFNYIVYIHGGLCDEKFTVEKGNAVRDSD